MQSPLPFQSTPFVDREAELAQLNGWLADPACRLVTISGPAGIGKTWLALQAAAQTLGAFAGGAGVLSVASLSSVEALLYALGDVLNLSFYASHEPRQLLLDYLRDRELLLLLDHCDQLEARADLLARLLEAAPGVKVLVTCRTPLNLEGERILMLEGLKVSSEATVLNGDYTAAVEQFVERARAVFPAFKPTNKDLSLIVRACRAVSGNALAVELVAGWTRTLSCAEIVERLTAGAAAQGDQGSGPVALHDVIDMTWRLLGEDERSVLRKLVVFRGGFRREAAPRVAGAMLPQLSLLVNLSLLQCAATGRYALHESVRQYVQSRLNRHPEEQEKVQHLHCGYYADFLQYREQQLKSAQQQEALEEIGEEIENIRMAWRWAAELGSEAPIVKSIGALARFYELRGWLKEGEESFGLAVEALGGRARSSAGEVDPAIIARLLVQQARFALQIGKKSRAQELCGRAQPLLERSMALLRQLGHRPALAASLRDLGWVQACLGAESATQLLEESISRSRESGDRWGSALALAYLAELARFGGDVARARRLYDESSALFAATGDRWCRAGVLLELADLAESLGEQAEARRHTEESRVLYRELGLAQPLRPARASDS